MSVLMEQELSIRVNRFKRTAPGHILVLVPSARTKTCSPGAVFVLLEPDPNRKLEIGSTLA